MVQRIIDAYQLPRTQKSIDAAAEPAGGPGVHIGPPVWWVQEDAKEMRVGAEMEWVKALPQRGLGVVMATRLHDSLKFAAAHQLGGRAHLGIKDSGIDLGLSAGCLLCLLAGVCAHVRCVWSIIHPCNASGTAICSAASALVYSIAAIELAWRLGGTGAATSEEAVAEVQAFRTQEQAQDTADTDGGMAGFAMDEEDELVHEDGPLASAPIAGIGGVGPVGRGRLGEGVASVSSNDLVPLMVFARAVRGLMRYPGNETWRWRAIKLWVHLLRGEKVTARQPVATAAHD